MKQLHLTRPDGSKILIALSLEHSTLEAVEAGASQAWHGVRANVRVSGGSGWVEVRENLDEISKQLRE
jgi:hypothetical protein